MVKENKLTIKDWQLGIGESPYLGFAQMVNIDIYSKPGSAKISNRLETDGDSDGEVEELIKWIVQDPNSTITYAVDRDGTLYKRTSGGMWSVITGHGTTQANGDGLGIWNDYLFYIRTRRIDIYGPLSGSPSWTNDWEAITPGTPYDLENSSFYYLHPVLSAQDGHLYIGNGHFVDTVVQTLGDLVVNPGSLPFDPTDNTTWTYNDPQLTLQTDYRVTCLEELGSNIAIGTLVGNTYNINIADMFFWDGASDSFTLNSTIRFAENGVQMTKNVNNTLYTIAGDGVPRIFNSVTSQAVEVKRFNNIEVEFSRKLNLFPGAIDLKEGEVLFGIGQSIGAGFPGYLGVYALRNGAYVLRYLISTGEDGTDKLLIGAIKVISSNRILVSWQDAKNSPEYGVDILTGNFYTEYSAYIESPIYSVGTEGDPKTFELIEVTMGKKLQTGDGIRIKARTSLDDTFTTIATFDTPIYVGRNTFKTKVANLGLFEEIQFRIELTTDEDSEISPELKQITLR